MCNFHQMLVRMHAIQTCKEIKQMSIKWQGKGIDHATEISLKLHTKAFIGNDSSCIEKLIAALIRCDFYPFFHTNSLQIFSSVGLL